MDSNLEKKLAKGVRFILAPFVVEVISMIYIKKFSLFILIGLITFLTGCSANKSEIPQKEKNFIPISKVETDTITENYKNLDISNTKITIPDVDEVYELNFPVSTDTFERQLEKFEYNIRKYEGLEEDTDLVPYMNIMYWDNEKNDRLVIPLDEATKEQKEQVQYIGYNDGICSELLVFSNFMLEMGDYAITTTLVGDQDDHSKDAYGYRSTNLGTSVATYDLDKDDISNISYHLSDGDLLLTEAVDYVEKHMKEDYYYVGSEYLDYSVFGIDVRKLTDEIYYYEFDVGTAYDGVALNHDDATSRKMREKSYDTVIIFISAYTSYCQELFEVEPLRFVQKPIDEVRFNEYLELALKKIISENKIYSFMFKHKRFSIPVKDIIYFESRLHTIIIHTVNGDMYQSGKLNDIENKFQEGQHNFLRIHQSFFVNLHYIQALSFSEVNLYDGTYLKISENRRKMVREQYLRIMERL